MNIKNLFNLFLISILSLSMASCDIEDDEPIEGSWVYQGVYRVDVVTNHPSLTKAIQLDVANEAKDYEHALVFDGRTMMKMYGYELDYSAYYTYRGDELTLDFGRYYDIYQFNISGYEALWRVSYFSDYAYDDGYIYEDMIYSLMNKYPFLRKDLTYDNVDLRTLYIDQVDVLRRYEKID